MVNPTTTSSLFLPSLPKTTPLFPSFLPLLLLLLLPITTTNAYRIGDAVGILLRTHTPTTGSATLEAYRHQLPRFGVSTKTRFDVNSLLNTDDTTIRLSGGVDGSALSKVQTKPRTAHNTHHNSKEDAMMNNNEHFRLSLSFDEGFHHIPWLDVYNPLSSSKSKSKSKYNKDKVLENLIITIVYSGSDGSIHAVHRETTYRDNSNSQGNVDGWNNGMPKSFTVEYIWVNEADVDVQGGMLVMFLAVFIVALSGMIGACTTSSSEEEDYDISKMAGGGGGGRGKKYKEKHSSSSLGVSSGGGGFAKRL